MTRLVVGADHGGFKLKECLKKVAQDMGFEVQDVGTHSTESVDYPDFAQRVGLGILADPGALGLMVDGAGIGSAIAANKLPGVRAAVCSDSYTARNAREHNHANLLCLGSQVIGFGQAQLILETFLSTQPSGGRHERRVSMIAEIERAHGGSSPEGDLVQRVVRLVVESIASRQTPAPGTPLSAPNRSSRPVLTERAVLEAVRDRPLEVAPKTIITPQARDTARALGLEIREV